MAKIVELEGADDEYAVKYTQHETNIIFFQKLADIEEYLAKGYRNFAVSKTSVNALNYAIACAKKNLKVLIQNGEPK